MCSAKYFFGEDKIPSFKCTWKSLSGEDKEVISSSLKEVIKKLISGAFI